MNLKSTRHTLKTANCEYSELNNLKARQQLPDQSDF